MKYCRKCGAKLEQNTAVGTAKELLGLKKRSKALREDLFGKKLAFK